jgi:hypothetical protein
VASGGTLTVQSIKFTGYVIGPTIINVEHGGLFFGDNVFNPYVRNEGSIFLKDSELISWANRGFSSIEGSIFIPDETDREKEEFTNSGYASLSRVNGGGISNSGILVVARSTLNTAEYCYDAGIQEFVCEIVAAIDNVGVAEVANSMVETCEGPVTDLGHNEFYAGGGCIVTDPTSTYYNGEVVEAAVRARPYHWREVGTIDLSTTDLMTIYVYSTETFDATRILFETVVIEGFDPDAKGWPWTLDVGRDGLMDYQVTWWLNRMPPLPCGYQEHEFSAMTEDGREVRGLLKFNAVGCTP